MVCIELKPDLTYEIDRRHKIVDFFIEDDYGVKHRCGQSFKLTEELIKKLLKKLNDDAIIVSRKELADSRGNASAVAQLFVWELNDKSMFPAKYYKDVLYYLLNVLDGKKTLDDKDIPEDIHYSKIVKEAQKFVVVSRKELEELYKLPFTSQGQKSVPTLHDFVGKLLDMESKLRK